MRAAEDQARRSRSFHLRIHGELSARRWAKHEIPATASRGLRVGLCFVPRTEMFRFFDSLVDPYPMREPEAPPRRLWAFVLHYSRPVLPWLVAVAVLTALVSAAEIYFFDWI